ncbi:MAG: protein kinase domain-containing protein [Acidimicrobiales bacterium]
MSIISDPVGRVLGDRYRLVATLGSGASAHVFLAEDLVLQRRVAVKLLQPALARDETFLRRFGAEARSVAALNHPHVLQVFDWGEGTAGPYLVFEYLAGGSLFDMLGRGQRLTPAQAARMGAQAAEGLAYAHGRGLVHRDVKPANLLFDEEGRVRVADFGVARALSATALTESGGTMLGTARYASPEQAQGLALDGRSDVYSLALVLYEAVTGVVPFSRDSLLDTLQARIGATLPGNTALGPLGEVLTRAAHSDIDKRPDATSLAQRLRAVADQLPAAPTLPLVLRGPVDGRPLTQDDRLVDLTLAGRTAIAAGFAVPLVDSGEPTPTNGFGDRYTPLAPARRRTRRRWPWVVAILVVVACILAAGAVYAVQKKLFTPSHPLPAVIGDTLASARSALAADHFVVKVEPAVQSTVTSGKVLREHPKGGTVLKQGANVTITPSKGMPPVKMPSTLARLDCSVATQLLTEAHLKAKCPALTDYSKTVPQGEIISWSYHGALDPTSVPYGATIKMTVSEGKPPVTLINYAGQSWTTVDATLSADGLQPKEVQTFSTTVKAGVVISTTPAAGSTVPADATVTVTVSKGPSMVTMPKVVGMTVGKATAIIESVGLSVGAVYGPATGQIFTSVPLAGQKVKVGSLVTLYTEKPGSQTGGTATGGTGGGH